MDPTIETPPALDIDMGGVPTLGMAESPAPEMTDALPIATGPWTPEVMRVLMQGIFAMLAAWRGPHWAYPDIEADPLLEPTATVFNHTPGLRDLAPEHMAIAVVVTGWGTIAGKRLMWDRQMAAERQRESRPRGQTETSEEPTQSPYGPNRIGG
jgi:hypothetical protein